MGFMELGNSPLTTYNTQREICCTGAETVVLIVLTSIDYLEIERRQAGNGRVQRAQQIVCDDSPEQNNMLHWQRQMLKLWNV